MTANFASNLATPPSDAAEGRVLRRGFCPGLSAPMQTGDGLLVRLLPIGTVPLHAFKKFCAAARAHGNGIVEITARGSIQVRGLSAASAPRFAASVRALGIAAEDGIPVHVNPLAGLDADEIIDAGKLAADLQGACTRSNLSAFLSPKASVTIDGGGALGLDMLAADLRFRAELIESDAALRVSVGGDAETATDVGFIAPANAVETAVRLLEVIGQRGRDARARNIIVSEGVEPFGLAVRDLFSIHARPGVSANQDLNSRLRGNERKSAIGLYAQRDRLFAQGIGLAFGHTDAESLAALIDAAEAAGASGMRTAAERALVAIGLAPDTLAGFSECAERLGFIVRPDDPRRFVVACAGAPVCAAAHIAARAMAPRIVADAAEFLSKWLTIHLSGCAKGCANPAAAGLTIVGTPEGCALVANGAARDAPFAIVPMDKLPSALAGAISELRHV